jgi:uncharacterized protein (DUF736 family)
MPSIGHVSRSPDGGFSGELRTLSLRLPLAISPKVRAGGAKPDYSVLADGVEFGAGWNRRSESSGRDYVSLALAAPEFGPRRIYVNLIPDEENGRFLLMWIPAD